MNFKKLFTLLILFLFVVSVPVFAQAPTTHKVTGILTFNPGISQTAVATTAGPVYGIRMNKDGEWVQYRLKEGEQPNIQLSAKSRKLLAAKLSSIDFIGRKMEEQRGLINELAKGHSDHEDRIGMMESDMNLKNPKGKLAQVKAIADRADSNASYGMLGLIAGILALILAFAALLFAMKRPKQEQTSPVPRVEPNPGPAAPGNTGAETGTEPLPTAEKYCPQCGAELYHGACENCAAPTDPRV